MTHSSQKKSKSKERSVSASLKPHKRPKGKNRDRGVFFESLKPTEQQKKPKRKSRDRSVSSEPPELHKRKVETVVSPPSLRNSIKEKVETVVSPPSLQNSKRSLKVRENVDTVLRNYQIIAVILSRRIHETKNSFWI